MPPRQPDLLSGAPRSRPTGEPPAAYLRDESPMPTALVPDTPDRDTVDRHFTLMPRLTPDNARVGERVRAVALLDA